MYLEDPPLFASEVRPAVGENIDQCIGPIFGLLAQVPRRPVGASATGTAWSPGVTDELPERLVFVAQMFGLGAEPPQQLKEYDPEWGRAFWSGTVYGGLRSLPDARARSRCRCCSPTTSTSSTRPAGCCSGRSPTSRSAAVGDLISKAGNDLPARVLPRDGSLDARPGSAAVLRDADRRGPPTSGCSRERAQRAQRANQSEPHRRPRPLPSGRRTVRPGRRRRQATPNPTGCRRCRSGSASEHVAVLDRQGIATAHAVDLVTGDFSWRRRRSA